MSCRRAITAIKQSENLAINIERGIQVSPQDMCLLENHLWSCNPNGYAEAGIDGKTTLLHALVFERMVGSKPPMNRKRRHHVRHIVADTKLDCRRENINQVASTQANVTDMNVSLARNNTSGVTGVCWDNRVKKWTFRLKYNYLRIHIGYYSDLGLATLVAQTCREARSWLVTQNLNITNKEAKEYLQRVAHSVVTTKELIDYRSLLTSNSLIRNDEHNTN